MNPLKNIKMEKIRYSTNMVFIFDYKNKIITPIETSEQTNLSDYIFIYSKYDNFMRYTPPCNKCLICSMCIKEEIDNPSRYMTDTYLYIKLCDKLKNFINGNELFFMKRWGT